MEPNPYLAALDLERRFREEPYLGAPHYICGFPLKEITPRLIAVLFHIQTPFFGNGEVTDEDILRFLWACHVDNPMRKEEPKVIRRFLRKPIIVTTSKQRFMEAAEEIDFDEAEESIWEFLKATFMDAPDGPQTRPYVCSVAAMQYAMGGKPFNWPTSYTLDQPLRIIYQLMRCRQREHGMILTNSLSDAVLNDALEEMNTPEAMANRARERAEFQRQHRERMIRENGGSN